MKVYFIRKASSFRARMSKSARQHYIVRLLIADARCKFTNSRIITVAALRWWEYIKDFNQWVRSRIVLVLKHNLWLPDHDLSSCISKNDNVIWMLVVIERFQHTDRSLLYTILQTVFYLPKLVAKWVRVIFDVEMYLGVYLLHRDYATQLFLKEPDNL